MTNGNFKSTKLFAWLQLFRPPNLLTVPGDVLAGYLLAVVACYNVEYQLKSLLLCMAASVCVYCAGLLQNDYCDREKDSQFRPERPIPSGEVSSKNVMSVAAVLFFLGLSFSWTAGEPAFAVCVAMVCSVVSYNCITKRYPRLGSVNMGLCRGLNLLLGASVLGSAGAAADTVLISAGFMAAYVCVLTLLAYDEEKTNALGIKRWLLPLVMICWFSVLLIMFDNAGAVWFMGGLALVRAVWQTAKVSSYPDAKGLQRYIGEMVRMLILIQATVVGVASPSFCAILLAVWIVSQTLSKWFYSS